MNKINLILSLDEKKQTPSKTIILGVSYGFLINIILALLTPIIYKLTFLLRNEQPLIDLSLSFWILWEITNIFQWFFSYTIGGGIIGFIISKTNRKDLALLLSMLIGLFSSISGVLFYYLLGYSLDTFSLWKPDFHLLLHILFSISLFYIAGNILYQKKNDGK